MAFKKIAHQAFVGQLGANLVERIVLQMRFIWRPLVLLDVGVDGDIEVCDPVTGEATNTIIRVQAKATDKEFQAETDDSFEFPCNQRDLDYWLRGNAPIILVVCRPRTNEAYWLSLKDYFNDLTRQNTRKVVFDKRRDRFDATCASALKRLACPRESGFYFAPLPKQETLQTNLIRVTSFAPEIHIAETTYRRPADLVNKFRSAAVRAGPEWILSNKRVMSFQDLEQPPFNQVCDLGSREVFASDEWAYGEEDKKRDFVRLLNRCLSERTRLLGLRYYGNERLAYYYFPATPALRTRKVTYQSIQNKVSREVFKQYAKKSDSSKRAYCRHSAFKGFFLRVAGQWYLEITPTYHFTVDGHTEDRYREERLKGIKRLERNPAVLGQLMMWAAVLARPIGDLFGHEYPYLAFGGLETVEANMGIPDDVWYGAEEGSERTSMEAADNQPELFGL